MSEPIQDFPHHCIDCKWCYRSHWLAPVPFPYPTCQHDRSRDAVGYFRRCHTMRTSGAPCGPNAALFEPPPKRRGLLQRLFSQ